MNRYRTYMDRVRLPEKAHARLMAALEAPPRPARRTRRYAALAACCALVLLAGWGALQGEPATSLGGPPDSVDTDGPGTALSPGPTQALTETPAPQGHTLLVGDPFHGRPHSDFPLSGFDFSDCTDAPQAAASIALPEGSFTREMTGEEIARALGGEEEVPWSLCWAGFGLNGTVLYDGRGAVWQATITGVKGEDEFTLRLSPGRLPVEDTIYDGMETRDYNGVEVSGYYAHYDRDGDGREEYVYHADFMSGDTGVRFMCVSPDRNTAEQTTLHLMRAGAVLSGGFTTEHLVPEEIPAWRSEALSLEEAGREDLGAYLPRAIPAGFRFEGAHRELGENRDWLSVGWSKGYDYIELTIRRAGTSASDVQPDFRSDEISAQTLEAWGSYVDSDAGDTPGWRFLGLSVDFGEVVVTYSIKGLTPQQASELVTGTDAASGQE